jgi:hypothetical protein
MTAVTQPRVVLVTGAGPSYVTGITVYAGGGHAAFNRVVIRSA